jgi:anti-sigma factor RsiW
VALILLLFRIPDVANRDAMASLVDQATLHLDGKGSFASTDPAELESWLEARIGYPISVPAIENAVLVGGRVAELDKVPSAALLYTIGGADLTYFALPASSGIGSDIPPDTIRSVSTGGFNMAVWTEADGPRAVVSAMDKEKVVVVARECKRNATGS